MNPKIHDATKIAKVALLEATLCVEKILVEIAEDDERRTDDDGSLTIDPETETTRAAADAAHEAVLHAIAQLD